MSNYTACNVKTIKTLRGSSQKGKLGSYIHIKNIMKHEIKQARNYRQVDE